MPRMTKPPKKKKRLKKVVEKGKCRFTKARVDEIDYTAVPTDGLNALYRDGSVRPNLATNFNGNTASFSRIETSFFPSRISWRASRVQVGHSESVSRGHPSGGLVFW